jgi:hypothetical protein
MWESVGNAVGIPNKHAFQTAEQFDLFVTVDRNLPFNKIWFPLSIAIVVLQAKPSRLPIHPPLFDARHHQCQRAALRSATRPSDASARLDLAPAIT